MFIRIIIRIILSFIFITSVVLGPSVYAQTQGLTSEEKAELTGTRKQLATIVFAGLAGAILGLSTLSFYGRPQEHLTNIAIGGALGVIAGAIFTTYKAATNPYEAYDMNAVYPALPNNNIGAKTAAADISNTQQTRQQYELTQNEYRQHLVQWSWSF